MIVNLKHVKKPTLNRWSYLDHPSFLLTYTNNPSPPNPRKTLFRQTSFQFFIQLVWLLLLLLSCFNQWCFEDVRKTKDSKTNEFDQNAENLFNSAVVFQFCDCILSVIISNKLRNITSWFNDDKHIKKWITVNNLYSVSMLVGVCCLVVLCIIKSNVHLTHLLYILMCVEGTITFLVLVFGFLKVQTVHKMYVESSSYIYLEQNPLSLCEDNSLSFSTNRNKPLPAGSHTDDILNV